MKWKKKLTDDSDKVGTFEVKEQVNTVSGKSRWVINWWVYVPRVGVVKQRRRHDGPFEIEADAEDRAEVLRVAAGWEYKK